MRPSIFLDLNLPNTTTWFYFSLALAIALFFQFVRPMGLRNWDLLALYLFIPGFLAIQDSNELLKREMILNQEMATRAAQERLIGYIWLLGASAFWMTRCFIDLFLVKRPLISPNMQTSGLAWIMCCLLGWVSLYAFLKPSDNLETVGKRPLALSGVEASAAAVVAQTQNPVDSPKTIQTTIWIERISAVLSHFAIVAGLWMTAWRRFGDLATGLACGVLYLLLPYTFFHVGQVHHLLPAALVIWSIYFFRVPLAAGILLGLAAGTAFFPIVLLPVWVNFYRKAGVGRFLWGYFGSLFLGLCFTLGVVFWTDPTIEGMTRFLNHSDWQPWQRPTADSIWKGAHWAYRLPVFSIYAGFLITAFFWPNVRNLAHLISLSCASLIGMQFWYADRGGLYILWYLPLLILVVLRPNLSDLVPTSPGPLPSFVLRMQGWVWRRVSSSASQNAITTNTLAA